MKVRYTGIAHGERFELVAETDEERNELKKFYESGEHRKPRAYAISSLSYDGESGGVKDIIFTRLSVRQLEGKLKETKRGTRPLTPTQ